MTISTRTYAQHRLAERAAPLLRAWDDCAHHNEALAALIGRDDTGPVSNALRMTRVMLSEVATLLERALDDHRATVAAAHGLAADDLPGVPWLLKYGERQ